MAMEETTLPYHNLSQPATTMQEHALSCNNKVVDPVLGHLNNVIQPTPHEVR